MARLWSCGFELNSFAKELSPLAADSVGTTQTIDSTTFRSGAFAAKFVDTNSFYSHQFAASNNTGIIYYRAYLYIIAAPTTVKGDVFAFTDTAQNSGFGVQIGTDLKPSVYDAWNGVTKATGANALNTAQWYRVELKVDFSSLSAVSFDLRIDGVSVATGSSDFHLSGPAGQADFTMGYIFNAPGAYGFYLDDIAINDSTGSFQNSYPGAGQIVHLKPSAAGDNNTFTIAVGGTAGASNNFTRVKEVTPNDATDYNADITSGDIDDFNIDDTPASIGSGDTINVVSVGVRYAAAIAAAEAAFVVRCKKAASGTVSESSAITPNSTAWDTNANAAPRNYPVTLYQDPDAGSWTKATLDTAQIGYRISTTNTNAARISTAWMLVDSTPAAVTPNVWTGSNLTTLKVG